MACTVSFGTVQGGQVESPSAESPFRIAFLADFTARQARDVVGSTKEIATRRLINVRRDNLDEVMGKLGVNLRLPFGDSDAIELSFASLDDFHPDRIHDQVVHVSDADELEQKCAWMNWILHHPEFQALEATWRGLDWLLERAAKGNVEVAILDISFAELGADVNATEDLSATALHYLLIDKAVNGPQGQPWAAFVGNYVFDLTAPYAGLLGRMAKIASQANAPFLATVHPKVVDPSFTLDADDADAWQALRELPEAALLGLSAPRFLLRPPYSANTQSIERFSFEEMSVPPDRSHYLWGNSALGCAALLAQAFQKAGWAGKPGSVLDLPDLPIHVNVVDGEEEVTQAETWLARPQAEQLVKTGIMAFLCVKGKAALKLARIHSVALPPQDHATCELQGHWGRPDLAPMPQRSTLPGVKVGLTASQSGEGEYAGHGSPGLSPMAALEADAARHAPAAKPAPTLSPLAHVEADAARHAPAAKPAPTLSPIAQVEAEVARNTPKPKPKPKPAAPPPEAPPAEEEMDPDLAALLKELE